MLQSLQSFFVSTLANSERLNESDLIISLGLGKQQASAMILWISGIFGQILSEQLLDNGLAKVIKICSVEDQATITILADIADKKIILNSSKASKEFVESFISTEQFVSALEKIRTEYEKFK